MIFTKFSESHRKILCSLVKITDFRPYSFNNARRACQSGRYRATSA